MAPSAICDLDGVVYRGRDPIAGSAGALERLEAAGWRVIFCTNNSSRTPDDVARRIGDITGYRASPEQVISSAAAAARLLMDTRPLTFVLGGEGITDALTRVGVPATTDAARAEAVVVGLATELTYWWLTETADAVRRGARFIATNHDSVYPAETGLWPGAGAIVAAVEVASGRDAEVAGKPFAPMRELLKEHVGAGPVWVIGDRPDTDLGMAAAEPGWHSALVLTGVVSAAEAVTPAPDLIAADLAAAVDQLLSL
jgi:HAD superfamily hydrolase (TIGR01450 family)